HPANMTVSLTDIRFGNSVLIANQNITVAIVLNEALSFLPDNVTSALFPIVGVTEYNNSSRLWYIDCDQANNNATLDFTLSWPVVKMTIVELVIPASGFDAGDPGCYFGIQTSTA